jgi:hypothetical protein
MKLTGLVAMQYFFRKEQDVVQAITTTDNGLSLGIMKQLVEIIISRMQF